MSKNSNDYFESYDDINVHNLMLRDDPRVTKYRDAILNSKNTFKDKIVLDVGSGTGLLSLFCAQAGAKHVYAVEASLGIFELSKAIVNANNLSDKITLINGEIEKVELPNEVNKVDIIVSEWMGFYLLHESMLNSVLFARDKWLREDGQMYPSLAYLYICPVEMTQYLEQNLKYWFNYNNLNFEPVAKVYKQLLLERPVVETISKSQLIDEEKILASFDLKTIKIRDLETIQSYNIEFMANRSANLHGFAFWFDVIFKTDNDVITLSTGPDSPPTHWKQTIALLPQALDSIISNNNNNNTTENSFSIDEDESFECYAILNQSDDNPRNYEIDIGVDFKKKSDDINKTNELENYNIQSHFNIEDDDDDDDDETSGDDYDDEEHPMPCDCGKIKCILIKASIEKYDRESSEKFTSNDNK